MALEYTMHLYLIILLSKVTIFYQYSKHGPDIMFQELVITHACSVPRINNSITNVINQ